RTESREALHEDRLAAAEPFDVRQSRTMAALAGNTRSQFFRLAESIKIRTGRMAAETVARAVPVHHPAGGLLQVLRLEIPGAHRQIETIHRFIEADATLVHLSAALKNICLPRFAESEGIFDRYGNRVFSVGDGIQTPFVLTLNPVSIDALSKGKRWVLLQNVTIGHTFHRTAHRRLDLR